jgi:hypothetical protein
VSVLSALVLCGLPLRFAFEEPKIPVPEGSRLRRRKTGQARFRRWLWPLRHDQALRSSARSQTSPLIPRRHLCIFIIGASGIEKGSAEDFFAGHEGNFGAEQRNIGADEGVHSDGQCFLVRWG